MRKYKKGLFISLILGAMFGLYACGSESSDTVIEKEASVNTDALKVREASSADANVLSLLPIDSQVTILGEDGEFYHISVSAEDGEEPFEGWVKKEYINIH